MQVEFITNFHRAKLENSKNNAAILKTDIFRMLGRECITILKPLIQMISHSW